MINSLDGIENLRCWNHLISNIELWAKRHDGRKHDWVFYKGEVKKIFQQETKEKALEFFSSCSHDRDENFKIYFEDHIK